MMATPELEVRSGPMMNPKKVKRVAISTKRQVCIPKEFYDALDLDNELIMELYGNQIAIKRPHGDFDDFSNEILKDVIHEGFKGEDIIREFECRKERIRPALRSLIAEAKETAEPVENIDDLFEDD